MWHVHIVLCLETIFNLHGTTSIFFIVKLQCMLSHICVTLSAWLDLINK